MKKRVLDFLGMLMVGDALLTLLAPKRHTLVWNTGPKRWRNAMGYFAKHPTATRWAGFAELLLGAWIAQRQKP